MGLAKAAVFFQRKRIALDAKPTPDIDPLDALVRFLLWSRTAFASMTLRLSMNCSPTSATVVSTP